MQKYNQNHKIKIDSLIPIKFANTILSQLLRTCFAVLVMPGLPLAEKSVKKFNSSFWQNIKSFWWLKWLFFFLIVAKYWPPPAPLRRPWARAAPARSRGSRHHQMSSWDARDIWCRHRPGPKVQYFVNNSNKHCLVEKSF